MTPTTQLPRRARREQPAPAVVDIGQVNDAPILGRAFWFTYLANLSMTTAFSLLYRYADFVTSIGGDERQAGLIVGAGMVGSLLMRLAQGNAIDVYGTRAVWLVSAMTYVSCCLGHLAVSEADGVAVFVLRIAMQTGIAGFVGASIAYTASHVHPRHAVEVVATLGTSGFIGTIAGTMLGDQLLGHEVSHTRMFLLSATIGCGMILFGWLATDGQSRPVARRRPPLWRLVRRYQPGPTLLMAVATGFGLAMPTLFLRPFADELGIPRISWFFFPYMLIALVARLVTRRWSARWGARIVTLAGGLLLATGAAVLAPVGRAWEMLIPAAFLGVAHALLFPTIVAGGSAAFPARSRGVGTTLMLAGFDLGAFLAFVTVGGLVVATRSRGWPAYPTTFAVVGVALALATIAYLLLTRRASRSA